MSRQKILIPIAVLLIIAALFVSFLKWKPESDTKSEKIIRQAAASQLNKEPNDLTAKDFAEITRLSLENKWIYDIKLLKKFTNLRELRLFYLHVPSSEEPKWKIFLRKLSLNLSRKTSTIDISPLQKLKNLKKLEIENIAIEDINSLKRLTNIDDLYLNHTRISNLELLRNLHNLQKLSLADERRVKDLEPLKELNNLQELYLYCDPDADLSPLNNLKNLKKLTVMHPDIFSFLMFKDLTNLQEIATTGKLRNLEALKYFKNLKTLILDGSSMYDLETLRDMTNLETLSLNHTEITNLEPLSELNNLQFLYLGDCNKIKEEQVKELQKALPNLKIDMTLQNFKYP